MTSSKTRLESLDILRGFDLFMLVFFQPVFIMFASTLAPNNPIRNFTQIAFTHVDWEGFHAWDLVMPLFLFMAGASIPFAFSAYKQGKVSASSMFRRMIKRVLLLFLFGMIVQGNLLDLSFDSIKLYTNTLQAIAVGYLFAALIYMFFSVKEVVAITLLLLVGYTVGMQLNGNYLPVENLAEVIDRMLLGRFVDGASVDGLGNVIFSEWYNYAWIYPSINFTATVLSGLLATSLLKSRLEDKNKLVFLVLAGVGCIVAAILLSPIEPIIKKLWTSSMTLLSSGISILLLALFYYLIDIKGKGSWLKWLKIYGMNSILAYMLFSTLNLKSLVFYWTHGLEQYLGKPIYSVLFTCIEVGIVFIILRWCYNKSIFLKV